MKKTRASSGIMLRVTISRFKGIEWPGILYAFGGLRFWKRHTNFCPFGVLFKNRNIEIEKVRVYSCRTCSS